MQVLNGVVDATCFVSYVCSLFQRSMFVVGSLWWVMVGQAFVLKQ